MQDNISIPRSVTVHPSSVAGTITAPASKSSMQRACAAALVCQHTAIIENPGISNDDKASLGVIRQLGASVTVLENGALSIEVPADQRSSNNDPITIDFGESGLGIRMFTSIAATKEQPIHIIGSGSLRTRPMDFFDIQLPKLGVQVQTNDGKLPLQIQGPLEPKDITIDGSLSSQFLTGLLLAYAAADATDVTIHVTNLKSKPYVDLTLKVMADFGLKVPENKDHQAFYFGKEKPATNNQGPIHYQVEGDWSGGAFLLVAGAIAGPLTVKGLDLASTQADKAVIQALSDTGCALSITDDQIEIGPAAETKKLQPFHFDANDCPDLFPPLVALATYCDGTSVIEGVERLTHKESNRALTLQEEFAKLGVPVKLQDNLMLIEGGQPVKGDVSTHSRHDHRIAMACAVAALKAAGPVVIEEAAAVRKSYPNFYQHLQQLGVNLSL